MLKVEPITFSSAFGLTSDQVRQMGAVDVALNCDTRLFIDPLLLQESGHVQFSSCATAAYRDRFELVIKLLRASAATNDKAWTAARRLLSFPEMPYTHLGYSSGKPGSGFGALLTDSLLVSAKQIIDLGVTDPDIFVALALFEENVGADRISDMTSHIILECLVDFTSRVASALALPVKAFRVRELEGREFILPANPIDGEKTPIILVPHDIVRDLPVASDWDSVASAASETQDLRNRVNAEIGDIWAAKTKRDKRSIKDRIVSSKTAAEMFLDLIRNAADAPYDISADHNGELYPSDFRRNIAAHFPLDLKSFSSRNLNEGEAESVVNAIIEKFRGMVEGNGIWSLLWNEKIEKPRHEKAAQQVFFAVANAYCEANNLDMTPEANAGSGPVDFKFSVGGKLRILVEIKKSTNSAIVSGYTSQLEVYKASENTARAHYVVIDYGNLSPQRKSQLAEAHDAAAKNSKGASRIWYVDASPQRSASKKPA